MIPPRETFIGWLWPVGLAHGRYPVISHEFEAGARYKPDGSLNYATHLGVDLMYPRQPGDEGSPRLLSAHHRSWDDVRVMAAGPGNVWEAGETALGHHVLVDHGKVGGIGMLTFYQHLARLERPWKRGDAVFPGLPLGIMGGDPANMPHLVHLHFEVWLPDGKPKPEWPVDPAPYLDRWVKL